MYLTIEDYNYNNNKCISVEKLYPNLRYIGYFPIWLGHNSSIAMYAFTDISKINSVVLIKGNGFGILEKDESLWKYGKMKFEADGALYFSEENSKSIPLYCFTGKNNYSTYYAMYDEFIAKKNVGHQLFDTEVVYLGNRRNVKVYKSDVVNENPESIKE